MKKTVLKRKKKSPLVLCLPLIFIMACASNKPNTQLVFEEDNPSAIQEPEEEQPKEDYYNPVQIRYEDFTYRNGIATVLLHKNGWELSQPFIELNSNEQLQLSFDDLSLEPAQYYFTLVHCDKNWQPSELNKSEYLRGFFEDLITDYRFSLNTRIPYIHYEVNFPNDNIQLTKSGNYLLLVTKDNQLDSLVLSKRFLVYENKLGLSLNPRVPTLIQERNYMQEVDFEIDVSRFPVNNPYAFIDVVLLQNYRWDNAKYGLKPIFIKGDRLIYDYDEDVSFYGNNEYRNFDIKSLRYRTEEVERVLTEGDQIDVWLYADQKRTFKQYYFQPDLNGNFLIKSDDGLDSRYDAEYVNVHFKLPMETPIANGNIYLLGAFTSRKPQKEFQLSYNYTSKAYEATLLLKQGYYNYHYAVLYDDAKYPEPRHIEGTHFDTENDYSIVVYYRDVTLQYDRILGIRSINTIKR